MVLGPEALRDRPRVRPLVEAVSVVEADRERLHRLAHHARHQRDDRARVDAAAEKRAQRNVGDQPAPDRLLQQPPHLGRGLVEARSSVGGAAVDARDRQLPVALDRRLAARLERQHVGWRQALDPREERVRASARSRTSGRPRSPGDRARRAPPGVPAPLDLAGEHERAAASASSRGASCPSVATQHQSLPPAVPDREGEHPVELPRDRIAS